MHSVSLTLPFSQDAPREARRVVDGLPLDGHGEAHFNLRLLVTELVANAVRHAERGIADVITLVINIYSRKVRVEVGDPGTGFARPSRDDGVPMGTGGRGLFLVDALADRWDVRHEAGASRTVVWFEFDL